MSDVSQSGVWVDPVMAALLREAAPPIVNYIEKLEEAAREVVRVHAGRSRSVKRLGDVLDGK